MLDMGASFGLQDRFFEEMLQSKGFAVSDVKSKKKMSDHVVGLGLLNATGFVPTYLKVLKLVRSQT